MLLYLSSYMFGTAFELLRERCGTGNRVALVANALDQYAPDAKQYRVDLEIKKLSQWDLNAEEIDLRSFFLERIGIGDQLDKFDLLWVYGGNSFVLQRAFEQSGLNMILADRLRSSSLIYGGFSAALVPVMTTLRGLDICDDAQVVPSGYKPEFSPTGLALVDRVIVPHFQSDHRESPAIDTYVAFLEGHEIPHIKLRDGEALLVTETNREIVGRPLKLGPDR